METLHYADEIRSAAPLFSQIEDAPADADLLAVATQLIDRKTAPFDAKAFKDHYDMALRALIEAKRKNRKTPRSVTGEDRARPKGENVVDLMEALRQSLKASGGTDAEDKGKPATKPAAKPAAKPATKPAAKPARKTAAKPAASKPAASKPAPEPAETKPAAGTAARAARKPRSA